MLDRALPQGLEGRTGEAGEVDAHLPPGDRGIRGDDRGGRVSKDRLLVRTVLARGSTGSMGRGGFELTDRSVPRLAEGDIGTCVSSSIADSITK